MQDNTSVRTYRNEDLPAVMDIADRAWQGIYDMFTAYYGPELFQVLTPDREHGKGRQVERHCETHPEWVFICEHDGAIVGFVTFRLDRERHLGEIGNNAVDPAVKGKGFAQTMYRAVLAHFREQGMRFAKVTTGLDEAHAPARKAYERAGFDIHHEDITYYQKL